MHIYDVDTHFQGGWALVSEQLPYAAGAARSILLDRELGQASGLLLSLLMPYASLLTPHSILLTPHSSLHTPHSILLTPHPTLLNPHSALLTPYSAHRTPHSALRTPRLARPRTGMTA